MKFSEETGKVIISARLIANDDNQDMINDLHILKALITIESGAKEAIKNNVSNYDSFVQRFDIDDSLNEVDLERQSNLIDEGIRSFRVDIRRAFTSASEISRRTGSMGVIKPEHILFTMISKKSGSFTSSNRVLQEIGADISGIITSLREGFDRDVINYREKASSGDDMPGMEPMMGSSRPSNKPSQKGGKNKTLEEYGKNLTQMAKDGKIDPVIGRDEEINRIMQILARRTKNNPCLVGDPGVGKTAIAEGLALKIAKNEVPEILQGKTVYNLDMGSMLAGTKYRGDFEERIKNALKEAVEDSNIILFIDEIHQLVGAGDKEGTMDAANIMKPMLTKNELQIIGATTLDEYSKFIEKDSALERRFQKVMVNEPSIEDAILILKGLKPKYEEHHKVRITDESIEQAVKLSARYMSDRFLPDKAIDLIDEAAARKRINFADSSKKREITEEINNLEAKKKEAEDKLAFEDCQEYKERIAKLNEKLNSINEKSAPDEEGFTGTINVDDVAEVLSKWSGIPVAKITENDAERLKSLESELKRRVIGQDEAVTAIAKAIRRSRLGLKDPTKPSGSFIFLGTTGVGKTELAKALAEVMFGDENSLVRIDMSEYQEKHDVSKLIGSPPGYVGYDEGGQLTEKIRRRPYSVVLFDEIEKAHPDIFNSMLQILDDGRLTDGKGRVVDFKNTIIIMTSNVGARMLTSAQGKRIGFAVEDKNDNDELSREGLYGGKSYDDAKKEVLEELKKTFSPEFINRVDEIIFFRMLGKESLIRIVDLLVASLSKRIKDIGIEIELTDEAKAFIAKKGYDPQYGARPLRRVIQAMVEDKLSEAILDGIAGPGKLAIIDVADADSIDAITSGGTDAEDGKVIVIRDGGSLEGQTKVLQED